MMMSYTYVPPPPLAEFVDQLWLYENYNPPNPRERLLPFGTVELVISLKDDLFRVSEWQRHDHFQHFAGAVVAGVYSDAFVMDTRQPRALIGVHFKPGGAFPFFPLPTSELHNIHVPLDVLWGRATTDLREQLWSATTPSARFYILERFLLAQARRPLMRHPAVAFALDQFQSTHHQQPIAAVVEQVGLSSRRFIQLFGAEVGLTPKLYSRVTRFQQVLQRIEAGQQLVWADIALDCGYSDQAHFIHDFQAFSGLNPTTYLTQRSEHRNHVPQYD